MKYATEEGQREIAQPEEAKPSVTARSYALIDLPPDLDQLRILVIAMAGNRVFDGGQKNCRDKYFSMFQSYNAWLWDFKEQTENDQLETEFPTLLFPTGYQKQLLAFGTEPTPEELQAAGTNVTREQYLGENLYHKFTTMQTNIRNKFNPHWKPLKRSGIPPEESQRLDFDEVLKRHWDNNQQLLHQQRVRDGPKKASYKNSPMQKTKRLN